MTMSKSYSEGDVTLHLFPRLNLRYYRVATETKEMLGNPSDDWSSIIIDRFSILEGLTRSPFATAPDDSAFPTYFVEREGKTLSERFELFETLFEVEHLNTIYQAYNATREVVLPIEYPDGVETESEKKDTSSNGGQTPGSAKKTHNGQTKPETSTEKIATAQLT